MPQFWVEGLNRETGEPAAFGLEASDATAAQQQANRMGFVVKSVAPQAPAAPVPAPPPQPRPHTPREAKAQAAAEQRHAAMVAAEIGRQQRKGQGVRFAVGCLAVLVIFAVVCGLGGALLDGGLPAGGGGSSGSRPSERVQADFSDEAHEQRQQIIATLMAEGVFRDAQVPGTDVRVMVSSEFYMLDYADKERFTEIAWLYYYRDDPDPRRVLQLRDVRTNKQVGSFYPANIQPFSYNGP